MKIRSIFFICILMSINACKTNQDTPNNLSHIVLSIDINFSKLKFDGIYNTFDTSILYNEINITSRPIIFLKNKRIFCNTSNRTDSMHFTSYFCNLIGARFKYLFGDYIIIGDSIFAYTPLEMSLRGGRIKPINANFSGYILNKDTILAWRMVKPYPNVNPEWNYGLINDTTPRTLYFIKNDAVKCLDSLLAQ